MNVTDTSKIPLSRLSNDSFDNQPQSGSSNPISSGAVFDALQGKLGTSDTAAKAVADGNGNIIDQTYAKISDTVTIEYEED